MTERDDPGSIRTEDDLQEGQEVSEDTASTRRRFTATAILATLGVFGGGAILGKQAVDAVEPTIEGVLSRETEERKAEMKAFLDKSVETANKLVEAILDFLVLLGKDIATWEGASQIVSTFLRSLARNVFETIESKGTNLSPDKVIEEVRVLVQDSPDLVRKWDEIAGYVAELQAIPVALEELERSVTTFDDEDKKEAWRDYKKHLWKEIQGVFKKE
jgi:hypothetical protein